MSRRLLPFALVVGATVVALTAATSAPGGLRSSPEHVIVKTRDIAAPPAAKKPPVCKKGQKSTKKKPCRKRTARAVASRANPPSTGWKFGFSLSESSDGTWALSVAYTRTAGKASESHTYSFQLAPSSVAVGSDLSTLGFDTGGQLGRFGAIRLGLSNPGGLAQGSAPAGCTNGTWQMRSGTLSGSARFAADGTYFKTLSLKSFQADLLANTSGTPAICGAPPPAGCTHVSVLFGGNAAMAAGFYYARLEAGGSLSILAFLGQSIGPAKVNHQLVVSGLPAGDLNVASDLSSAQLSTSGASPWLTGGLTFAPTGAPTSFPNTDCGTTTRFGQGKVSGVLVAHFAAIGAFTTPTDPAYLEVA